MTTQAYDDGLYWVRVTPDSNAEVARCRQGTWHLCGTAEAVDPAGLHCIGRAAEAPADAFRLELEADGKLGV